LTLVHRTPVLDPSQFQPDTKQWIHNYKQTNISSASQATEVSQVR
jgi:hypothetical protein